LAWAAAERQAGRDRVVPGGRMLVEKRPHASTTRSAAPIAGFRSLLEHLATLTRNQVRFAGATATVPMLAEPTSTQREAFHLIGAPVPLTLK
jgi:hypothetical protein